MIQKGERIGIIGKNGTGKSSFLNIITGSIKPDHGKIVYGETLKFGYYTQQGIQSKPQQKVIDVVREFGDYIPLKKGKQISAQQLLERFLEKLSGGERKRLYLCTVLIQNPNFLILDEPTNDLDIVTLNVLENFLLDFPGCLIVVSHDRYFMDKIVDHLFVFRGNGIIEDFPGNYSDFRVYEDSKPPTFEEKSKPKKKQNLQANTTSKLNYNDQKELNNLESKLKSLEYDKKQLEAKFENNELDMETIEKLSKELQSLIQLIEEKELRWIELIEKFE
jgi:ATP-binding cassette subfamily F protein uup